MSKSHVNRRPLLLLAVAIMFIAIAPALAARRPNIVIFLADDLGYGEPGCYGGKDIPTPHIDALAAGGVRFTSGYVTAPYCAPSRAGFLTGRYQSRFGFEHNPTGARNEDPKLGLPTDQRTIADLLRRTGYATGLIGKWHQGAAAAHHPMRRGFDEFYGFMHEGHSFVPRPWRGVTTWLRRRALPDGSKGRWTSHDGKLIYTTHMGHNEPDYDADNPILRASQPVDEREHLTDAIAREANDFIDRHRAEPFFLFVSFNAVHSPMQATDAYMEKFAHIEDVHRRIFAGMLAHMDDSIGRVMAKLKERGLQRDTLVVFLSDNGGPTRELTSSNAPLRGGKGQLYEGGVRVPFVMYWTGKLPAGVSDDRPIISADLLPTALAAAGADVPRNIGPIDGVNLLPFLTDKRDAQPHEALYWRFGVKAALRSGDWKLVREGPRGGEPRAWELYNLRDDIAESRNLAADNPGRVRELGATWHALNEQMAPPAADD